MRFFLSIYSAITLFSLTSCYIGPGGVCGPQTPIIYCSSKEDQDKLLNPKPYGAHWIKEGMTRESRLRDFSECGGDTSLKEGYEIKHNQSREDFFKEYNAHVLRVRDCMLQKDYHYLPQCDARCMAP